MGAQLDTSSARSGSVQLTCMACPKRSRRTRHIWPGRLWEKIMTHQVFIVVQNTEQCTDQHLHESAMIHIKIHENIMIQKSTWKCFDTYKSTWKYYNTQKITLKCLDIYKSTRKCHDTYNNTWKCRDAYKHDTCKHDTYKAWFKQACLVYIWEISRGLCCPKLSKRDGQRPNSSLGFWKQAV